MMVTAQACCVTASRAGKKRCGGCHGWLTERGVKGKPQRRKEFNIDQRFDEKWEIAGECWQWLGAKIQGYGRFWVTRKVGEGRHVPAHRFSYERAKGSVPENLHIDHLCRNPSCVNPEHLDAVTCKENLHRSPVTLASTNLNKAVCVRGHEFTGTQKNGKYRRCLLCVALLKREARKRRR